jgi:maleate isomerase
MNNFKKLGFIIPSSCTVFEFELAKLSPQISTTIGCVSRLLITDTNEDGLNQMNEGIELAARQLATINPDVINYVCTSGSFKDGYNGNNNIKKLLKKYSQSSEVTTTSESVLEALKKLKIKSLVLLTPYNKSITQLEIDFLNLNNISVYDHMFLDIEDNLERGNLDPKDLFNYATKLDFSHADGILLSCTNVTSMEIIKPLEKLTNKSVITSNQASIWHSLRLSRCKKKINGYGKLLSKY